MSSAGKPVVAIYADPLLSPTMTFVLAQGEALEGFTPYYIGPRRLGDRGLKMPADRTLALNGMRGMYGKIREAPFRRFGFAPFYFQRLRRLKPVLLHAHSGPAGLTALRLAEWLRVPQVTTFHGFDATTKNPAATDPRYGNRDYVRRKHVLMEKSLLFIAVSRFIRDRLLQQGFREEKVLVHYTGVDTEFFSPNPSLKRDAVVLFVGRLTEVKGCQYLIEAMARAQGLMPELELVVIGDGPLRQQLEELAWERLSRFRFLGMQSPEVIKSWMNRARVLSVPSVPAESGAVEGLGMVFLEAQAMGCPVATFASGGIPEAVAAGQSGLLAKERDTETLSQNILQLVKDEALWLRMSQAGRERVRALFDLSKQTRSLEDVYLRVLNQRQELGPSRKLAYAL